MTKREFINYLELLYIHDDVNIRVCAINSQSNLNTIVAIQDSVTNEIALIERSMIDMEFLESEGFLKSGGFTTFHQLVNSLCKPFM